jgi:putative membrane protein
MEATAEHKAPGRADLAETNTALSAERTLMSWMRTALAMISFGFSLYNFMHAFAVTNARGPRRLGIILAALGTLSLTAGAIQYASILRSLGRRFGFPFYVACAVIVLGLLVLGGIVLKTGPLS